MWLQMKDSQLAVPVFPLACFNIRGLQCVKLYTGVLPSLIKVNAIYIVSLVEKEGDQSTTGPPSVKGHCIPYFHVSPAKSSLVSAIKSIRNTFKNDN